MKKMIFTLLLILATLFPCFAQKAGVDISVAINDASNEIARKINNANAAAVASFYSDSKEMSEWLENEMFRALSKKNLKLVERNKKAMNVLNNELDFQYSGAVSDDTIAAYGQKLGARYIIYGSFEQFGGMKNFDFRMTDVETYEIIAAKSYEIKSSAAITELLGAEMQLSSISDYIAVINNLEAKQNLVQKEMNNDRNRAENAIRLEYQKKINNKTAEITELYDGMYSGSKLNAEIANAIKPIESERDALLKPIAGNSRAKFADQLSSIENNRVSILREMQNTTFVVDTNSISVELLRRLDSASEVAYFALNLRSTDKYVNYSLSDRIDPKTPADFKKIRDMTEKTKSVCGEISYSLRRKSATSTNFDVVISSVRVYDSLSGDTLYKKTGNELADVNGGTVNMVAQKVGVAERNISQKNVVKSTSTETRQNTETVETSNSSSNPFENNSFWVANYSKNKDAVINVGVNSDGELFLVGNTGMASNNEFERWIEICCNHNPKMISYLQTGKKLNFKVRGDGNSYILYIELNNKSGNTNPTRYQLSFKTKKNQVTNISIPYSKLVHATWTPSRKFNVSEIDTIALTYDFWASDGSSKKEYKNYEVYFYDFEVTN